MLKTFTRGMIAALALLGVLVSAHAATPEDAKALTEKAAALVAAEGDKAFTKLNDPNGGFIQGELYVVVMDPKGVVFAHGNPKLVGVTMWEAKDPDGVLFTQEIWKLASTSGTGWVTYKFTNPASKKIEPKKTWVHKVGDYVVLAGVYVKE
jgi:signal transduction histidine kinase